MTDYQSFPYYLVRSLARLTVTGLSLLVGGDGALEPTRATINGILSYLENTPTAYETRLANAQRTEWYINAATGSDLNDGTDTAPLATYAEWRRRLMYAPIPFNCRIYVQGSTLDQIVIDQTFPVDSKIHIQGVPTSVATGAFGVVQAKSEAANRLVEITSATLVANVAKVLRVTAGTAGNIGATSVILKDTGADVARCSNFVKKTTTAFETGVTEVTPVLGDTFEVMSFPTTTIPYISAGSCEYAIEFMDFAEPSFSYSNDFAVMCFGVFWSCSFRDYFEVYGDGTVYFNGCGFMGGAGANYSYLDVYDAARIYLQAGGMIGNGIGSNAYVGMWSPTARIVYDYSFAFQNAFSSSNRGGDRGCSRLGCLPWDHLDRDRVADRNLVFMR